MLGLALVAALAGCKSRTHAPPATPPRDAAPRDATAAPADADAAWPELASFPRVEPIRVVPLPARPDVPRFDVGGPVIAGDVAVVASSQFGFLAIDYHQGQIVWSKPAGMRIAPPIVQDGNVVLIGECVNPPDVPDGHRLLGCVRVVTPTGTDLGYVAIHGRAHAVEAFADEPGPQRVWSTGDHTVTWRRGEQAIGVDLLTGVAAPAPAADPPLVVRYGDRSWDITHADDGRIVARQHHKPAWQTEQSYTTLLGAVYLPEQSPMVRVSNASAFHGNPELMLLDIDATGSMHGQVAFPVPGIGLLGHTISSVGDVVLAVRLDRSLRRDFIVGYAANALLRWVYPLPERLRPDPVGVAIAPDVVVVFHDGDTFTILPDVSAPPTAPGAVRAP